MTRAIDERLGIVGGGAIATGLAATAARLGPVTVVVRTAARVDPVRHALGAVCARLGDDVDPARVDVVTDRAALAQASFVVEAIAEDVVAKRALLAHLDAELGPDAILATTTSSLSIADLAAASGRPDRFAGLHVFNPVPRMALVELCFTSAASEATRDRAVALCEALGKTAVEVPDVPGFVVNRLLFPYLFAAVRTLEETGLSAEAVDACMTLGTGHPMGPLSLLDLVGLDVALAIGDALDLEPPARLRRLAAEGALGRKAGRGFHSY